MSSRPAARFRPSARAASVPEPRGAGPHATIASRTLALASVLVLLAVLPARGQQILMDRGVRAGDLWCFPVASDTLEYVYLPSTARLARDEAGRPKFSFIRYVVNENGGDGAATVTSADGGGILHFLVLYETPEETVRASEQALREQRKNDEIVLRGPIVFTKGSYSLVSSVLTPEGKREPELLTTGSASVLAGNLLAFSFALEPERASLLLESFRTATPDVSLVFDMTFSGLTDAYDAELVVDWSELRRSEAFQAGGSIYMVGAEVKIAMDRMLRDNTIRLRSSGSDARMEALLTTVYDKLLTLLFRPVEPEEVPEDQRGGLVEALEAVRKGKSGSGDGLNGFGIHAGYQLKEMRSEGTSVLRFDHRASVDRHSFITFNIGDLYRRFGQDSLIFRAVNLADPTFQERHIRVGLDGELIPEFDRYVNTVTLTLRKVHGNGQETVREVILDRRTVDEKAPDLRLVYGWKGDRDRTAWLSYQYRTHWSFEGGGTFRSDWIRTDAPSIDIHAPYRRRTVRLIGDMQALLGEGVRAVIVRVEYPFFGRTRRHQIVVTPRSPEPEYAVDITLPQDEYAYGYRVAWRFSNGNTIETTGRDDSGLIFIDEIP